MLWSIVQLTLAFMRTLHYRFEVFLRRLLYCGEISPCLLCERHIFQHQPGKHRAVVTSGVFSFSETFCWASSSVFNTETSSSFCVFSSQLSWQYFFFLTLCCELSTCASSSSAVLHAEGLLLYVRYVSSLFS